MRVRDESGAVAVIVAITASVLFMFGAFAVDLGAAYSERRADQNAADAAALGGANALPDMGGSSNDAMRDAGAYVEANLVEPEGGWGAAWAACTDPDHLAQTSVRLGQCVSISAYGTRVRVVIPTREVKTTLAAAMGIESISVSALAEAQIEYAFSADLLPFGIPPSASNAAEVCLKSTTNGASQQAADLVSPCDGSDQGNFGTLDFTHFGSAGLGTLQQCTGQTQDRLTRNIILGVDHAVSTIGTRSGTQTDLAGCLGGGDHGSRPNGVATQTGGPNIQQALILGVEADKLIHRDLQGRLAQPVAVAGWPTDVVQSEMPVLDNQALWDLIDPDAAQTAGLPQCAPEVIEASVPAGAVDPGESRESALRQCLTAASGSAVPLFTVDDDADGVPDLAESHRFAFVPVLNQEFDKDATGHITGTKTLFFIRFVPVYLQSVIWTSCQGKDYVFRPDPSANLTVDGVPTTNTVHRSCKADGLTAMVIPEAALPTWIADNGPAAQGTPQVVLHR